MSFSGNTYSLKIISSAGVFYEGRAISIIVPCINGEIALMAHHEDIVIAVDPGIMRYETEDGTWHEAAVATGSVQFANNRCTVLVDTCEKPENIDRKRAQAALERAQEQMRQCKSMGEYRMTQASLARALTRLRITKE